MINRGSIDSLFDSIFVMVARSALIFSQYCHNFFHAREILSPIAFIDRISCSILASPNMVSGKLGLRMTTLHEETSNAGNQVTTPVHDEDEEKSDADYSEYDSYQVVHVLKPGKYSLCITYIFRYIHDYYIRFSLKIWMIDF